MKPADQESSQRDCQWPPSLLIIGIDSGAKITRLANMVRMPFPRRSLCIGLAGIPLLWPIRSYPQTVSSALLTYGVTGEVTGTGRRDPGYLLGQAAVQGAVVALASGPLREVDFARLISSADAVTDDLVAAGIVARREDGSLRLALNFLSKADRALLTAVADEFGRSLADRILKARSAFEAIEKGAVVELADWTMVRFASLGCVALDWDGLAVTAELGLRLPAPERPGIGRFIPWARENDPLQTVRALYWGSHNEVAGQWWFTTFGDHQALPRWALPDLVWNFGRDRIDGQIPAPVRAMLAQGARESVAVRLGEMADVLARLRRGPLSLEQLQSGRDAKGGSLSAAMSQLLSLNYVERIDNLVRLRIPVFTEVDDAPWLRRFRAQGRRILSDWLATNHFGLKRRLQPLSALRAGVPFEQLFTEIWHDVFGWTNYHLVRSGWLWDLYGPRSSHTGFLPFVWEASLKLND